MAIYIKPQSHDNKPTADLILSSFTFTQQQICYTLFMEILALILCVLLSPQLITAQEPTNPVASTPSPPSDSLFTQYQSDYQYQVKLYQDAYRLYTEKKQINLKYNTVTTQKEALAAAKNAIQSRNNLLKSYLLALRVKLDMYQSANPDETEKNKITLNSWEKWLDDQNPVIETINNAEDAANFSQVFKSRHNELQKAVYTAIIIDRINQKTAILNQLTDFSQNLKKSPQIPSDQLHWFNPINIQTDLIRQAFNQAITATNQIQVGDQFSNFYPEASQQLIKVDGYLIDITKTLKSIIIKFIN